VCATRCLETRIMKEQTALFQAFSLSARTDGCSGEAHSCILVFGLSLESG
jgi:hypothetical protein